MASRASPGGKMAMASAARRLYARAGYRIVETQPFSGFGQQLTNEIWELDL